MVVWQWLIDIDDLFLLVLLPRPSHPKQRQTGESKISELFQEVWKENTFKSFLFWNNCYYLVLLNGTYCKPCLLTCNFNKKIYPGKSMTELHHRIVEKWLLEVNYSTNNPVRNTLNIRSPFLGSQGLNSHIDSPSKMEEMKGLKRWEILQPILSFSILCSRICSLQI